MKNFIISLKIALLFVGTIIGAGFASGRELLSFFGISKSFIPLISVLCFLFFYLTSYLFFQVGKIIRPKSFSCITTKLYGKGGFVMDMFMLLSYFIIFSGMLAGVESLTREGLSLNFEFPLMSLVTMFIAIVTVLVGIKGLVKVNSVIVPIVVIFIIGISIASLFTVNNEIVLMQEKTITYNIFSSVLNSLLYVGMNMFLSAQVIASAYEINDGNFSSSKSSFIGSVIIMALIVLILTSIFNADLSIFEQDMPMIMIAGEFGVFIKFIAVLVTWGAIFTTLIASVFPVVEYFDVKFQKKFRIIYVPLIAICGYLLSLVGFSFIVDMFLPIMGGIGVFFIISTGIFYNNNKNSFNK